MNKIVTISIATLFLSQSVMAKSSDIQKWVEVTPQKGYILSVDLHKDKQCSKIWSKQIKEFLKMNPHIKNANMILVNQKIKVQDCKVDIKETSSQEIEQIKSAEQVIEQKAEWFIGAFAGANILSEKDDTAKSGMSLGLKVGQVRKLGDKKLSLAAGLMFNKSKTKDEDNSMGVYQIQSPFLTLESSLLFQVKEKIQIGPKLLMLAGDDVSLSDKNQGQKVGLYLGAESLINLKKDLNLEVNLQQRVDELSRTNILGNLGLRLSFNLIFLVKKYLRN